MMSLQVITMASFLTGIGASEEDQKNGGVLKPHRVGVEVLVMIMMRLILDVVVVGLTEVIVFGLGAHETVLMIG